MAPMYRAVNHDFFKKWTPEMAYVLGYFEADGSMIRNNRGAHFIEFTSIDKSLVLLVRRALSSSHTISVRLARLSTHKISYRIQIGSKEMFNDLRSFGFMQNKSNTIRLPKIPQEYFGDFVRGYFDGDGNVYFKKLWENAGKKKKGIFACRFTSGSKKYLEDLHRSLKNMGVAKGFILAKSHQSGFELVLSHRDSLALYQLIYNTASCSGLFLPRKYKLFQKAIRTLYPALRA